MLRSLLTAVAPPVCAACGDLAGSAEPLCAACRVELRWLGPDLASASGVELWAPLAYEGPAREIVRTLKFGRVHGLAETMAAQIAANAPPGTLHGTLVPVPLHPARLRTRGFNQAERLASALGERCGLPVADILQRSGDRSTQVGRSRGERLAGISGSVSLRAGATAPPAITLVDDVITTGATLAAAAALLREAGAGAITAVGYARTPGR